MSIIVTTFPSRDYELYGKKFIKTFHKYWPEDYKLIVYTDEMVPVERGECVLIQYNCSAIRYFIDRNKDDPRKCGREAVKGWQKKHIQAGYNYKFDAVKWVYQAMVPYYAYTRYTDRHKYKDKVFGDKYFIWMDADVVTKKRIPEDFIDKILDDYSVAYLGREKTHTECGFIAFRIGSFSNKLITDWFDWFSKDTIFTKEFWNSAHAFDYALEQSSIRSSGRPKNLTEGLNGHVWHKCILGEYMDHLKGKRKELGYSPEAVVNG